MYVHVHVMYMYLHVYNVYAWADPSILDDILVKVHSEYIYMYM